jgi:hypothetical protein
MATRRGLCKRLLTNCSGRSAVRHRRSNSRNRRTRAAMSVRPLLTTSRLLTAFGKSRIRRVRQVRDDAPSAHALARRSPRSTNRSSALSFSVLHWVRVSLQRLQTAIIRPDRFEPRVSPQRRQERQESGRIDRAFLIATPMRKADWTKRFHAGWVIGFPSVLRH